MDPQSIAVYKSLGFTHFTERLRADGVTPEFHKPVKKSEDGKGFVDENGVFYEKAKALPGNKKDDD